MNGLTRPVDAYNVPVMIDFANEAGFGLVRLSRHIPGIFVAVKSVNADRAVAVVAVKNGFQGAFGRSDNPFAPQEVGAVQETPEQALFDAYALATEFFIRQLAVVNEIMKDLL